MGIAPGIRRIAIAVPCWLQQSLHDWWMRKEIRCRFLWIIFLILFMPKSTMQILRLFLTNLCSDLKTLKNLGLNPNSKVHCTYMIVSEVGAQCQLILHRYATNLWSNTGAGSLASWAMASFFYLLGLLEVLPIKIIRVEIHLKVPYMYYVRSFRILSMFGEKNGLSVMVSSCWTKPRTLQLGFTVCTL